MEDYKRPSLIKEFTNYAQSDDHFTGRYFVSIDYSFVLGPRRKSGVYTRSLRYWCWIVSSGEVLPLLLRCKTEIELKYGTGI